MATHYIYKLVLLVPMITAKAIFAATATVGGITWNYAISDGEATLGEGYSSPAVSTSTIGAVVIPSTLDGNPVVSVGAYAFRGCSCLTSVTIPDSVTSIDYDAFADCSGLTNVTLGAGVTNVEGYAFSGCSGLMSFSVDGGNAFYKSISGLLLTKDGKTLVAGVNGEVDIPDGVTNIRHGAFWGRRALTSVAIPDSVERVGEYAFNYCSGLKHFSVAKGNVSYESVSGLLLTKDGKTLVAGVNGEVDIPDGVTCIGGYAFNGCSGLTSVKMPDGVMSISVCAFNRCGGLTSVSIPDSVKTVEIWAFSDCDKLTSVEIGSGVTHIDSNAFSCNSCLVSFSVSNGNSFYKSVQGFLLTKDGRRLVAGINGDVAIPDGVTDIGEYAFRDCNGLINVVIPSGVTNIGHAAFFNCKGLMSVTIPNSVTSIGDSAFSGCSGLTSVTIPDSVTGVGNSAFSGCSGLTNVTIGNGITSIGDYAFSGCSGLTNMTIPDGVVRIGTCAFYCDWNLRCVVFQGGKPSDVAEDVFVYTSSALVSYVSRYAEGWNNALAVGIWKGRPIAYMDIKEDILPFTCTENPDGTVAFASYTGKAILDIFVPEQIDGKTVTAISSKAFASCAGLQSITLPATVRWLEDEAFADCSSLISVTYLGDAPDTGVNIYKGTPRSLVSYVSGGSLGWSGGVSSAVPEIWNDRRISCEWMVKLDANGGIFDGSDTIVVTNGSRIKELPMPTMVGYTFSGWYISFEGGEEVTADTVVIDNMTLYARWTKNCYAVSFDANGGVGGWSRLMECGTAIVVPTVTRSGYVFTGWLPSVPATVPAEDFTCVAQWTKLPDPEPVHELFEDVGGVTPTVAASEYNGYLYDEKSGAVMGIIQVKVGKPGKDGKASVKATVVVGTKKVTLKAKDKGKTVIEKDGPTEVALVGGAACEILLGVDGLSGFYGAYLIDGSRNFFASKDKAEAKAVNGVLAKWLGSFMVVWDDGSLSVSVAAKGKVKVSGTLADGKTKVSVSTVLLVGEEWSCISVADQKANLAFVLWLSHDGQTIEAEGLGEDVHVGLPGTLANGATFQIDPDEFAAVFGRAMLPYLPDGVPVTQKGSKWTLPKAGKVVYKNGVVDESKLGDNPCGLKLTYKVKEGTFKGSFKVYAEVKGKPKATTVNATGFMFNGIGYGTATIKGKGSVAVTIK